MFLSKYTLFALLGSIEKRSDSNDLTASVCSESSMRTFMPQKNIRYKKIYDPLRAKPVKVGNSNLEPGYLKEINPF